MATFTLEVKPAFITSTCANHPKPEPEEGQEPLTDAQWAFKYWKQLMVRDHFAWLQREKQKEAILDETVVS